MKIVSPIQLNIGGTKTLGEVPNSPGDIVTIDVNGVISRRTPIEILADIGAAGTSHTHDDRYYTETEVNTLLSNKSDTTHNHTLDSLSNVTITSNSNGEILRWSGTAWINNTLAEAGIAAASHNHSAANITSGTLGVARGGTGIASYTIGNYIRASAATTLEQRTPTQVLADIGAAAASHTHSISNITGLQTALDGKAATSHTHVIADITSLQTTLDSLDSRLDILESSSSGGLTWNTVSTTSATMSVYNGYITNNESRVALSLPATASVGSVVRVAGVGSGGWRISQASGQSVVFGNTSTTVGATGNLSSTHNRDAIELVCVTANSTWQVISSVGNIEVV